MKPEEIKKLAIECGASTSRGIFYLDEDELAAYTAAVEAPLKDELYKLHSHHNNSMIAIGKSLGEDVSNEPRFKWVDLAAISKMKELKMAQARIAQLEKALLLADEFITNGVALKFIRMPDVDCPDPAKKVWILWST